MAKGGGKKANGGGKKMIGGKVAKAQGAQTKGGAGQGGKNQPMNAGKSGKGC